MEFLNWLEGTALSTWVREGDSLWAYPAIITLHSAGLAIMVGLSAVVSIRLLGFARDVPLAGLRKVLPWIWFGFWVNAASGVLLIVSEPSRMLTNQIFVVKMALIACAVITIVLMGRILRSRSAESDSLTARTKTVAMASLALWVAATTAGRLTAYLTTF
jgi:hypothetical protein